MSVPKILVISASLRAGSPISRLAALAAKEIALAEAEVTRISLEDYPLPLFDADAAVEHGPPHSAVQLQRMLAGHQGVFIASPEYSASVTPLLKNAIDWLSRSRGGGEPDYAVFRQRVFAIGSASRGPDGGLRGLIALRQILELGCGALVIPEQVSVGNAGEAFDEMENLKDENSSAALRVLARRLIELAQVMAREV
jgi:chromate reductase, NAD(P)H dehydrogenase (quinone)